MIPEPLRSMLEVSDRWTVGKPASSSVSQSQPRAQWRIPALRWGWAMCAPVSGP